jgi:hypothetical protein
LCGVFIADVNRSKEKKEARSASLLQWIKRVQPLGEPLLIDGIPIPVTVIVLVLETFLLRNIHDVLLASTTQMTFIDVFKVMQHDLDILST